MSYYLIKKMNPPHILTLDLIILRREKNFANLRGFFQKV